MSLNKVHFPRALVNTQSRHTEKKNNKKKKKNVECDVKPQKKETNFLCWLLSLHLLAGFGNIMPPLLQIICYSILKKQYSNPTKMHYSAFYVYIHESIPKHRKEPIRLSTALYSRVDSLSRISCPGEIRSSFGLHSRAGGGGWRGTHK